MSSVLPDPATPYGQRVAQRLRDEIVIWLTTVSRDGTPQPNPVWFLWDGTSILIYTLADAVRLAHIARNPRVSLHLESGGKGNDIIILTGEVRVTTDDPPSDQHPDYLAKYRNAMIRVSGSEAAFAAEYRVTLRVTPAKVRGF
ncbi:MAG TPA: TIGR03667 family PPOX class F420-dependent oxidoreductase [Ktedonobacterales bacterium]|nr:TIGR03667 family PPOX class F420-dependent oxidoreductase [Ktedonobacterales bacterium]